MTGLCPMQHALTGWHMWLEELQAVTAILPLTPRARPPFDLPAAQLPARLFDHSPIYPTMHRSAWVLSPREIAESAFNVFHTRGADTLAYTDLPEMLQMLASLVAIRGASSSMPTGRHWTASRTATARSARKRLPPCSASAAASICYSPISQAATHS